MGGREGREEERGVVGRAGLLGGVGEGGVVGGGGVVVGWWWLVVVVVVCGVYVVCGGGGADLCVAHECLSSRAHACNKLNGLVPAHKPLWLD